MTGGDIFDQVEQFLDRFIVYPSEHARVAHTLWIGHAWGMEAWESTPRIAFLSPEPGSGKSRALEVTEPLVPRPVHAVNTTPAYLFRKVSDPDGAPTILYDEIDTVFGLRTAKDNEDIRGMLNAGHRKGAVAGRCVIKGKQVVTEELPAYCAVAMAGLDDLPDTLRSRAVLIRMRRRAADETVEPWRNRVNGPQAAHLAEQLEHWIAQAWDRLDGAWPIFPDGVTDRAADVWEPLLTIADALGGSWPERARAAAVALVAEAATVTPSLGVKLLQDLRTVFVAEGSWRLSTDRILELLTHMEDAPWSDLRGKPLDSRGLSRRLAKYDVRPKVQRFGAQTARGYDVESLADAWKRYVTADPLQLPDDVNELGEPVSPVTHVTAPMWEGPTVPSEDLTLKSDLTTSSNGSHAPDQVVGPTHIGDVTSVTPDTGQGLRVTSDRCVVCGLQLDGWLVQMGATMHLGCEL